MKSASLISALALIVTAGSALAADLPSRKGPAYIPPPPPPPLWTGFYVGLNAGYTWSGSNAFNTVSTPLFVDPAGAVVNVGPAAAFASSSIVNLSNDGFIGGGQIGYNWQFYSSIVVGVEADIQGIAGGGRSTNTFGAAAVAAPPGPGGRVYQTVGSVSRSLDYLGTVRGRLGYAVMPTLLAYATGGLAYGGVSVNSGISGDITSPPGPDLNPFVGGSAFSDTRVGWTVGGGLEWMFLPNWSAKVEYLYYDLGSVSTNYAVAVSGPPGPAGLQFANALQTNTRFDGHIVRAGLNYHFNWGAAPVVAKY